MSDATQEDRRSIERRIIEDGGFDEVSIVAAIFVETGRIIHYTCEYGDEDGINAIREFIKLCGEERLVRNGEVKIVKFSIDLDAEDGKKAISTSEVEL